jgi:hypothetical protein
VDTEASAFLAHMFAQELTGLRVEEADVKGVPLNVDGPPDPAGRGAVIGGFDFNAAVEMNGSLAVLVVAERFQRQRQQGGFLFGEHGGDLPLGGAVDAGIGPLALPAVKVILGLLKGFEALALERRFLSVSHS